MRLRPTVQLSLGLVILTSAILVLVDLIFGVFGTYDEQLMASRRVTAETLTAQITVLIEQRNSDAIGLTLDRMLGRDAQIASITVRRADGSILAQSGEHAKAWSTKPSERSTLSHLVVPLNAGQQRWGSVEVAYSPDARTALQRALGYPLWVTLASCALLGGFVYYQYMRRALVHLDPKGVIPERVRLAFDIMTEGVVVLDSRGRVLLANRAFCQLIERDDSEITGEPLALLSALASSLPADPGAHPWNRSMQTARPVMGEAIDLMLSAHRSAKLFINCAPITDARGAVRGCVATFADFSALHMANERLSDALTELAASRDEIARKNVELEQMATHDVLTGCLTRRAFLERMSQAYHVAQRDATPLSCLALDIDHFKRINDTFGHAVGDRVIQEVGATLRASVRAGDLVGRYGGDEFLIGLPGCDPAQARALAEKLCRTVETACSSALSDGTQLQPTVSIGVELLAVDDTDLGSLIERADKSLYAAKAAGRNRVAGMTDAEPAHA